MLRHHLLIAFRNMKKFRGSFLINLFGLSTGLACSFFIYLWVHDELRFDRFHEKDSQLYQVMEKSVENDKIIVHDATQGLLAETMARDLPEIEMAVPVFSLAKEGITFNLTSEGRTIKAAGIFSGKDFFNVFSFPLREGHPAHVLTLKDGVVLSEQTATGLFGSPGNAMGKMLELDVTGFKKTVQVTGISKTLPAGNSLDFDFVLTYEALLDMVPNFRLWWNEGPNTYLTLKAGTDIKQFNEKIETFLKKYHDKTIFTLFVRPYSDAYLYGKYENGIQAGGRIGYVKLFSIVAVFILIIACINFMNLATARAARRMKEVGIKKAVGSTRQTLMVQFLSEAVFISLLSLVIAIVLVGSLLPVFNEITGKQLSVKPEPYIIISAVAATIFTGLLAGSYPALYLSGFNPVEVLKGKLRSSWGELFARKGLIVFQFIVSLILIVAVLVIRSQIEYIQSKNPGYEKDNVVQFEKEGMVNQNQQAFIDGLKKIPGVKNASFINSSVVQSGLGSSTYGINWPGKTDKDLVDFAIRNVDYDMIETLGIQVVQGRSFSKDFGSDSSSLIFNETAINTMRLKNPVGTKVVMWGKEMTITGVVKDFHITSLHEPIAPVVFRYDPRRTTLVMAKITGGKEKETLARMESYFKTFNPGYSFNYRFLDESYQAQYLSEKRVSLLSRYFAGLAMLISCLGLIGLSAFNAEVRTKEIGIRKVLGASVSNVVFLLSKDFFKLLALAVLIAFPLAWLGMNQWLNSFAYRTSISISVFTIALFSIILVTILAVSFQAIKAAVASPVKNLRTE